MRTNAEIERVVDEYATMLLRVAYSQLNNRAEAEDAVQEVLLKYIEKAPTFQSEEHEKAWLLRVTINHCKKPSGFRMVPKTSGFRRRDSCIG